LDNLLWLSTTESVWGSSNHFLQMQDIDASDTQYWNDEAGFSPIGCDYDSPFCASYNGANHIIDRLYINRPDSLFIGLFGYSAGAIIESLSLCNINVIGNAYVGGLVGRSLYSSISSCCTTGSVTGNNIISENSINIGGLVGISDSSTIFECYSSGSVEGYESVGGLVGLNDSESSINECYSSSSVEGYESVGGLIGLNDSESSISDCFTTSVVSAEYNVGGLVGYNQNSLISECYMAGQVSGNENVGGLVGANNSSISNCIWNIETSGQTSAIGNEVSGDVINLLGATSATMRMISTYTDIGWDFVGETVNGTEDTWDLESELNNGWPYITAQGSPSDIAEQELLIVALISKVTASPNPFNPETRISFELGETVEKATLSVYNIKGQRVWEYETGSLEKGKHLIIWSGQNRFGDKVVSGVYLYQVKADKGIESGKMILLK